MKKNTGITMISLAVTIVVLIILAGVSINMLVGNNDIITQAQKAKENMELAKIQEEEQLNNNDEAIEKLENFKKVIATAITEAGVPTAETDEVETMANNIGQILIEKTKDATATEGDIAQGKTA